MRSYSRRTFLKIYASGITAAAISPLGLMGCTSEEEVQRQLPPKPTHIFKRLLPQDKDELLLAEGLSFQPLIAWGDAINDREFFGFNNDFIAFLPNKQDTQKAQLWVNHEYVDPKFVSGYTSGVKSKPQVDQEMKAVGGSLLNIQLKDGNWSVVYGDENKRVDGNTRISFNWEDPVEGSTSGQGTLGNCSGGLTPWGTILTCEENFDDFYGEHDVLTGKRYASNYGWEKFYPNPPEHYGWVVEVDPKTGTAQKHIALGRCRHECATVQELEDGRLVVYTGDDANNQCLYKFVSSVKGSLKDGTLYVANVEEGKWIPLERSKHKALEETFDNQTQVLTYLKESAHLVGGSKLDRPEDIEIDPVNGNVLIALTNNRPQGNLLGSIAKLTETSGYDGETFTWETHLAGGEDTGFACPDNMVFDPKGNLWFTSDISGSSMNKGAYASFKNNGLFFVPRKGPQAGEVIQVASAPVAAELTGPCFTPDGKTLFLSVQHPGETSTSLKNLTSHWPEGGDSIPKPAVVQLSGPFLDAVMDT